MAVYFPAGGTYSLKTPGYLLLVVHSNRSGIPLSSRFHKHLRRGTNNTSSIQPLSHLLSGIAGCSSPVWTREGFAQSLSVIPEAPLALVMGGRNVMTGHFKGDSVQGHVTLSLTTL